MLYSDEQLYDFIWGLIACRYTYGTTIHQAAIKTHVQYGNPISNRIHEFFVKQDHLQKFLQQLISTDHWLTIISNTSIRPNIPGYQFQTNECLMHLESNEQIEICHKYSSDSTKIEQVTSYIKGQEINTYFQVKAINLEQLEQSGIQQYVLYDGHLPIGFGRISSTRKSKRSCLDNVYIEPSYRRQGLATKLCIAIIKEAENRSTSCILASSEMGYQLYINLGFKQIAYLYSYKTEQSVH